MEENPKYLWEILISGGENKTKSQKSTIKEI